MKTEALLCIILTGMIEDFRQLMQFCSVLRFFDFVVCFRDCM